MILTASTYPEAIETVAYCALAAFVLWLFFRD